MVTLSRVGGVRLKIPVVNFVTALLIGAITCLYVTYAHGDYVWYHDGGAYLSFARNIARGLPYAHGADFQILPPGYPFILAVWGTLFSWEIASFQILNLIALGLFSFGSFLVAKKFLPTSIAWAIGISIILGPALINWHRAVATEFVFSALMIWALYFWHTAFSGNVSRPRWLLFSTLALVLTAIAITVRSLGVAIAIASVVMLFIDLLNKKQIYIKLIFVIFSLFIVYFAYNITPMVDSIVAKLSKYYINIWNDDAFLSYILDRSLTEFRNVRDAMLFWPSSRIGLIQDVIDAVYLTDGFVLFVIGIILLGIIMHFIRHSINIVILYLVLYVGLVVFTSWSAGVRYILPILPLILIFMASALYEPARYILRETGFNTRSGHYRYLPLILPAVVFGTLITYYITKTVKLLAHRPPPAETETEIVDWVLHNTTQDQRTCTILPGDIYYFTDRTICGYFTAAQRELEDTGHISATLKWKNADYYIMPIVTEDSHSKYKLLDAMKREPSLMVIFLGKHIVVFKNISKRNG